MEQSITLEALRDSIEKLYELSDELAERSHKILRESNGLSSTFEDLNKASSTLVAYCKALRNRHDLFRNGAKRDRS